MSTAPKSVLVIGGGVAGQRAALDLAQVGLQVVLVERSVSLGGTVAQLGPMFPLHNCLLCRGETHHGPGCTRPTISAQLLDHARPDNLRVWTRSQVIALEGGPGDFSATIRREPRYIRPERCINCDRCAQACPQELPDPFQAGLVQRKAAYRPALRTVPDAYALDVGDYCLGCARCVAACPTAAIDLGQSATTVVERVSSVILASGIRLYDAALSQEYGYGRFANVFTGLEMERMTSPAGPGEGRILRRSDGLPPQRIAWLQCVGSRDKAHDYCSSFCCGYATRQAVLARQLLPQAEARILLMDDRVFDKSFSATYDPLRAAYGIGLLRCRPSVIREDPATRDLLLQEPGDDGCLGEQRYSMVVLSVGAQAAAEGADLARALGLAPDAFGFVRTRELAPVDTAREGLYIAGGAAGPASIADSVTQGAAAAARVCAALGWRPQGRPSAAQPRPAPAERRIGVFICHCAGEIGAVLDLPRLTAQAASGPGVVAAQVVPYGCFPEGLAVMRAAIRAHGVTDAVIGACNARTYGPLFQRELAAEVQFVSLREECAWVHRDDPPGAMRVAQESLRMAVERAYRQTSAAPIAISPVRAALVVGGGLAGLTAAAHLADAGLRVHLVEREAHLGGNALGLAVTPGGEDTPAFTRELIARVTAHPQVTLHIASEVQCHGGRLGRFTATLRSVGGAGQAQVQVGATVVATGGEEYRGPAYALGASRRVLTLLDLGRRLAQEPEWPCRLRQVVFVSCVGPWDEPGSARTWRCSRTCCQGIMREARALKEAHPSCQVIVLHREINTYAFGEEQYTAARAAGVLFVRFDPAQKPQLVEDAAGLRLTVRELTLGETLDLRPELVVLAAAILPRADAVRTASLLDVPQYGEGFLCEWESKTQSYASLQPGVYLCGLAHGPKPAGETIAQALAAAQHAAALLSRERITLSPVVAQVDGTRCVGCLTCVRVCPYDVPRIDDRRVGLGGGRSKSFIDPARCQGCGTCVADCPGKAIELAQYGDEQLTGAGILGRWLTTRP